MNATPPGPLAPEVLGREDLRRALQEHDFAAVFSLVKKYSGLSQNHIAAACRLSPAKVSTTVKGTHRITHYDVIGRIADGLRIPGHLLGLAPRPWEACAEAPSAPERAAPPPAADLSWRPAAAAEMAARLTRSDLVMDRRAATRALAAAAVTGVPLLDSLEGWRQPFGAADARQPYGRLGVRDVEELEESARAFRQWDRRYGGGLRRKAVLGQLAEVAAHLEEQQKDRVEVRLHRVMAQLAGTAASMAWDAGMQRQAQDYYRLAVRAAHAGRDALFGANVLAAMARQMLYCQRPQDALELVRLAQDGTRTVAGPRLQAMLHTREAWALAALGRRAAFRRATAQAHEYLAAAHGQEPYWIAYFTQAELDGVTGGRLLDLARHDPRPHAEAAADSIRRALAQRGPEAGRGHILDRIGLAEAHFLLGDLTQAASLTLSATDAASHTHSKRVRAQLGRLYPYTVGHDASRPLREARGRIRALLSS
ncbi:MULTISPECIES: hypothetical protein [Streptomyces]|uniref:hypothetical protein n=1 Tax=Streptomyces TaxID=1883 RepID=UPI0004CD51C1|nr:MULTISPECIES: hypothetical protein [Streptomyces]KOT64385.1 XRE family transcriptional regulator [Streptomyces rimosus subsp. rimosus]